MATERSMLRLSLAAVAVVLVHAGCSCQPSAPPDAGQDGGELDVGGAPDVPRDAGRDTGGCTLATVQGFMLDNFDDVEVRYRARVQPDLGGRPFDLYLWFPRYDTSYVGTFPLGVGADANFGTCPHCVIAFYGSMLENSYFADQGTLTLNRDPFDLRLDAVVENLRLVQVTIEGDDLHSVPVPGGACLVFDRIEVDRAFPPPGWTCAADRYADGSACDCRCGIPDADCFDRALPVVGCMPEQVCIGRLGPTFTPVPVCVDGCDRAGDVPCPRGGVCVDDYFGDICEPEPMRLDRSAGLGGTCTDTAAYCAIDARGFALGYCDVFDRTDHLCRSRCTVGPDGVDDDCDAAAFERCFTLGSVEGGDAFGFCSPRYPAAWTCVGDRFEDGASCDCACGAPDPDCLSPGLPLRGCGSGERCLPTAECAAIPVNDTCAGALPLTVGMLSGSTRGGADDYTHVRGAGGCIDVEEDGPDVVYAVPLTGGQRLTVRGLAPGFNIALYLIGPGAAGVCDRTSTACVAGVEATAFGEAETLVYTAASAGTYYLVVDAFFSEMMGDFTLDTTIE